MIFIDYKKINGYIKKGIRQVKRIGRGCPDRVIKDLDIDNPICFYLDARHFKIMTDNEGIRVVYFNRNHGLIYNACLITDYAITCYQNYLLKGSENDLEKLKCNLEWLLENQEKSGKNIGGWPFAYAYPDVETPANSLNASCQARAISLLLRCGKLFKDERMLEAANLAFIPMQKKVNEGGVQILYDNKYLFFETYISENPNYILGGFLRSILALRDLHIYTGNEKALELMNEALRTLKLILPEYDMGYWARYSLKKGKRIIASISYMYDWINFLRIFHRVYKDDFFLDYAEKFDSYLKNPLCCIAALYKKTEWRGRKILKSIKVGYPCKPPVTESVFQ